jgi:hypothetical protein
MMPEGAAEQLGYDLYWMGFRPLPDIDEYGRLRGVRMWRSRPGFLEYILVRPDGLATAGRVVAEFDYRRPFEHGPVLETRRGYVANTLQWLLSDMDLQTTQPIPAVVPEEVAKAREAARSWRRHTPPWEDPNRLMAGRTWESSRDCTGHPPAASDDEDDVFEDTGRHRLTDTARHRLSAAAHPETGAPGQGAPSGR